MMDWTRLISDKRLGMEEFHDPRTHIRSDFQRDYDRMIFSSPFRRLQNKTQVFPLPGSIFVHNRLTHSLEVSSVGRSMAREAWLHLRSDNNGLHPDDSLLSQIPDIVAAACLCHDIGNPPFGHSGEKTIASWFSEGNGQSLRDSLTERQWCDLVQFEGNANSFRLLTHQFSGRRRGGFAMTYSTLASIVKYPWTSTHCNGKGKFGFFESEETDFRKVADWLGIPEIQPGVFARHPLVYLTEAADDICYQVMDIEDSHRLGIIAADEAKELFLAFFNDTDKNRMKRAMGHLDDPNEQIGYLRSNVIGALVTETAFAFAQNEKRLLAGEDVGPLVKAITPRMADAYAACSNTAWNKIYCAPDVVDVDIAGNRIITYLMDRLMEAVLNPGKNSSRLLLLKMPRQYETSAPTLYERIQSVVDHVSGMTDVYALDLFRKLNGHSLPAV